MPSREAKRQALLDIISLLEEMGGVVDAVVVEGPRDVRALRQLGFQGRIEVCSRVGISDGDLVDDLAQSCGAVVIFTDYDEEGQQLNRRLSRLLERRGVRVEKRLRHALGKLMAVLDIYTIEALDNVEDRLLGPGL